MYACDLQTGGVIQYLLCAHVQNVHVLSFRTAFEHNQPTVLIIIGSNSLFADGVVGCSGSTFVVDRLWQLLCAVLPARRRIIVSIPALNQVSVAFCDIFVMMHDKCDM